jgi:hypothetical protein
MNEDSDINYCYATKYLEDLDLFYVKQKGDLYLVSFGTAAQAFSLGEDENGEPCLVAGTICGDLAAAGRGELITIRQDELENLPRASVPIFFRGIDHD